MIYVLAVLLLALAVAAFVYHLRRPARSTLTVADPTGLWRGLVLDVDGQRMKVKRVRGRVVTVVKKGNLDA